MIDLRKYGLEGKWPRLAKLQREVSDLERRRGEAEGAVAAAQNAIPAAQERDAAEGAKAIRAGKTEGAGSEHEDRARAAFSNAERNRIAYAKAAEEARAELVATMAEHREAIYAALVEAVRKSDQELAHHAREAARRYAFREDAAYDLKALAPPPAPPDENAPAQRLSTSIIAIGTARTTGPSRGDVEQTLSYLAGLAAQFAAPDREEGDVA